MKAARALFLLATAAVLPFAAAAAPGYSDRPEVREFAREVAARNGMNEERILAVLRKATYVPAVLRAIEPAADPLRRSW
jgi:hypothetical protein